MSKGDTTFIVDTDLTLEEIDKIVTNYMIQFDIYKKEYNGEIFFQTKNIFERIFGTKRQCFSYTVNNGQIIFKAWLGSYNRRTNLDGTYGFARSDQFKSYLYPLFKVLSNKPVILHSGQAEDISPIVAVEIPSDSEVKEQQAAAGKGKIIGVITLIVVMIIGGFMAYSKVVAGQNAPKISGFGDKGQLAWTAEYCEVDIPSDSSSNIVVDHENNVHVEKEDGVYHYYYNFLGQRQDDTSKTYTRYHFTLDDNSKQDNRITFKYQYGGTNITYQVATLTIYYDSSKHQISSVNGS